jgi:hypothetical protein
MFDRLKRITLESLTVLYLATAPAGLATGAIAIYNDQKRRDPAYAVQQLQSSPVHNGKTLSSPDYSVNFYGSSYDYQDEWYVEALLRSLNLKGELNLGFASDLNEKGRKVGSPVAGLYDSRAKMSLIIWDKEKMRNPEEYKKWRHYVFVHEMGHHLTKEYQRNIDPDFFKKWTKVAQSVDPEIDLDNYLDTVNHSVEARLEGRTRKSDRPNPSTSEELYSLGYVSGYAMTDYQEDTAETLTFLLTETPQKVVSALKHSALAEKIKLIEKAGFIKNLPAKLDYYNLVVEIDDLFRERVQGIEHPIDPIYGSSSLGEKKPSFPQYVPRSLDHDTWDETLRKVHGDIEAFLQKYLNTEEADRLIHARRYLLNPNDVLIMPEPRGQKWIDCQSQTCDTTPRFKSTAYVFPSTSASLDQSPQVKKDPKAILYDPDFRYKNDW